MGDLVSVMVTTHHRPECLEYCLRNISRIHYSPLDVLVMDDSKDGFKEVNREIVEGYGFKYIPMPYRSGLSKGRNNGYQESEGDYILQLDDDLYPLSNILELRDILDEDENYEIGGVAGALLNSGHKTPSANCMDLRMKNGYLKGGLYEPKKRYETSYGASYYLFDYIHNFTLYRKECLDDISWDEFYRVGFEHIDFFYAHALLGKWRFAFTPNYIGIHDKTRNNEYYNNSRNEDLEKNYEYLCRKWGLKGFRLGYGFIPPWKGIKSKLFHYVSRRLMPIWLYQSLAPFYQKIVLGR